jgi:hypothetical protein
MAITPRAAFASIDDFIVISGLSRRQIYNLISAKLIPAHKHGSRVLIDVDGAINYIKSLPAPEVRPQTRKRADAGFLAA